MFQGQALDIIETIKKTGGTLSSKTLENGGTLSSKTLENSGTSSNNSLENTGSYEKKEKISVNS